MHPGCSRACCVFLRAGVKGMCHHAWKMGIFRILFVCECTYGGQEFRGWFSCAVGSGFELGSPHLAL